MLRDDLISGAKAAADFIGVTPRAVYHLTEQGLLPCVKKGRKLYFRRSEIEAAFRSSASLHSTLHDDHGGASGHSTLHDRAA